MGLSKILEWLGSCFHNALLGQQLASLAMTMLSASSPLTSGGHSWGHVHWPNVETFAVRLMARFHMLQGSFMDCPSIYSSDIILLSLGCSFRQLYVNHLSGSMDLACSAAESCGLALTRQTSRLLIFQAHVT